MLKMLSSTIIVLTELKKKFVFKIRIKHCTMALIRQEKNYKLQGFIEFHSVFRKRLE